MRNEGWFEPYWSANSAAGGQAHTMLTAAGQETGDTDLFLLVPEIVD